MADAFEPLCTREEYDQNFPDRLREGALTVGGLFTLFMRLKDEADRRALRYPAQVVEIEDAGDTPSRIAFSLFTGDMMTYRGNPKMIALISSGVLDLTVLWTFPEYEGNVISQGYFLGYEQSGGFEDELRTMLSEPAAVVVAI
jgi:hypothetical protein